MKFRLVKAKRGERNYVVLIARGEDGKKYKFTVTNFFPYYYVLDANGQYKSLFGERLRKIVKQNPDEVKREREKYSKHYEADIPYARRFLIDTKITSGFILNEVKENIKVEDLTPVEVNIPFRYIFIDIEVGGLGENESVNDIDPKNPIKPIIALAVYDSYTEKIISLTYNKLAKSFKKVFEDGTVWLNFSDEFDMLFALTQILIKIDPDMILGWNIAFDIDYLKARMKKVGIDYDFGDIDVFDYLDGYRRLYRRQSYHLNTVAIEEGFTTEWIEFSQPYKEYLKGDVSFMQHYNRNHVKWLVDIEKKHRILDFYLRIKELAGVENLDKVMGTSTIVDTALLRLAKEEGVVLPSVPNINAGDTYEGAVVFDPISGLHENVAVFDMSRYYPSIIVSFNLSPETKHKDGKGDIKVKDNLTFVSQPLGILPKLCLRMFVERDMIQKEMKNYEPGTEKYEDLFLKQQAVKFMTNAIYGFLAFRIMGEHGDMKAGSRLYDEDIPSTITMLARNGIRNLAEYVRNKGLEVVYGDTDSIMIKGLKSVEEAKNIENEFNEVIERYYKQTYGVKECKVRIKFSQFYKRLLLTNVKKRYIAKVVWDGKECDYLKITGFEAIRTDQSKITIEMQKEVAEAIVNGKSREEVIAIVKKYLKNLKSYPLKDVAIRKGIEMSFSQYKVLPPHVRGSMYTNTYLGGKIKAGNKVLMLWLKGIKGYPSTDVICFTEDMNIDESILIVDWDRMKDLLIKQKLQTILEVLNISWEEVEGVENLKKWL